MSAQRSGCGQGGVRVRTSRLQSALDYECSSTDIELSTCVHIPV